MFPTNTASTRSTTTFTNGVTYKVLDFSRGAGAQTQTDNTVASLGAIVNGNGVAIAPWGAGVSYTTATPDNPPAGTLVWISEPIAAVTISGSITYNIRGLESNAMANYGAVAALYRVAAGNGAASQQAFNFTINNASPAEFGTTEAALNFSFTGASRTFSDGDMIALVLTFVTSGSPSASGFTASGFYAGASGATGDTFVTFTETITPFVAAVATPARPFDPIPFIA